MKLALLTISLLLCCAGGASAATLDPIGDFDRPIFVTSDPGNPDRLFVAERQGKVIEVNSGGSVSEFADLTPSLVSCCVSERGLLSIALAPDFGSTGRFYAAYTGTAAAGGDEGDIHIDAFRQGAGGIQREPILQIGHATNPNHNGGQLQFGPDGYLYISTGDGGGGGDPSGNGQNLESLLGKVLRIDPHPGTVPAYGIPVGNPFATSTGRDEVWSYGLRNPWRFSFDRANGDMVIGDVGQEEREEVDQAASPAAGAVGGAGTNYGWNCREGFFAYPSAPGSCPGAGSFTDPIFDYPHTNPGGGKAHGCAITGGYVVRDPSLDGLYGRYLYADFCAGDIRSLALPQVAGGLVTDDRSEGLNVTEPVSFGEDSCARVYVVSQGGTVYRFKGGAPADCSKLLPILPASTAPVSAQQRQRARVLLNIRKHRLGDWLRLILTVRVSPCAGHAGDRVQLQRGGKRVATKRLDRECTARFHRRTSARSTFKALLPSGNPTGPSRSQRLVVHAVGAD
ncbi:MAG TPA: PQQ-dependent sugar dehydrogenase [Solirubrobacterales bacterium]|nr:PQQ-dependent sugar dehydrogenase [Solirubrobacterales bacterium]